MRDYGKVHSSFWTSGTILALSEDARMLALYLLTSPHSTISGVFRLPDGYVCEDIKWSSERVAEGFTELLAKGFANRCETTKWVYIYKHFDWNRPENPNQRKAAKKIALSVPDECGWKPMFMRDWGDFLGVTKEEYSNPFETVNEPFLNQKQEQEQEHITNPVGLVVDSAADDLPAKPTKPDCPHQQIIALYHELLPASPEIRDWTPARSVHLRTRWNEKPERQNLDWWRRFFGYIAQSEFLTGRAHARERKPFCAPLDWICKAENFAKIIEGRYHEEVAA